MKNHDVAETIFKKALSKTIAEYYDKYGFNIFTWIDHKKEIDKRSADTINKFLNAFLFL